MVSERNHPVQWSAPSPLWDLALADRSADRFRRPALLRFATDSFIDDLAARLAKEPATVADLVARPETWEQEEAGWEESESGTLKLYQPVHGRFYLVAAALVCRIPGLPDRTVNAGAKEKASFVIRRLVPVDADTPVNPANSATYREHGWVPAAGWAPAPADAPLTDEERLPLFALNFAESGRQRRLLAGFIPVSGRETYQAGPGLSPIVSPWEEGDPRPAVFETRVSAPLLDLNAASPTDEEARDISIFILLDFAEFLAKELPSVWLPIEHPGASLPPSGTAARTLYDKLATDMVDADSAWAAALRDAWEQEELIVAGDPARPSYDLRNPAYSVPDLVSKVNAALAEEPAAVAPITDPPPQPKLEFGSYYWLRCVYERPCCGALHPPVISDPTRPFMLASFFDPDAPARPVHIQMPADTSMAGLRRFKKSVSVSVSKQLRNQLERMRGMTSVDKDEIGGAGSLDLGMICSLSIPIITICALVLLLIIVQVLNIVFWWKPFLKICFPVRSR